MTLEEILLTIKNVLFYEFTFSKDAVLTPMLVLTAVGMFILSLILSKLLQGLLKRRVMPRLKLDRGIEFALLRFIHYAILGLGIYVSLQTVGLDLTVLAGFLALLGVGIGFGLQNITSNFISGIILLLERPVKIGDRITVDDMIGDVQRINLRTTLINTLDNISVIVPNAKLLENNVVNWSYGDRRVRVHVPVGVAYGSDMELVRRLLLQVAEEHEHVLKDPPAKVFFEEFGDSSLNVDLRVWLGDSLHQPSTKSDLNFAIDKIFRENDVEIPFPQRDLHIISDATKNASHESD